MKRFLLGFVLLGFVATGAMAQVSVTNGSPSFLIDFSNSMPTTVGTNPSTAFAGADFEPAERTDVGADQAAPRALPGDPAAYFAGGAATQEAVAQVRAQLGE